MKTKNSIKCLDFTFQVATLEGKQKLHNKEDKHHENFSLRYSNGFPFELNEDLNFFIKRLIILFRTLGEFERVKRAQNGKTN